MDLWSAYKWLKEYQVFPVSGGWLEQSAKFISCVKYCDYLNLKFDDHFKLEKKYNAKLAARYKDLNGKK